MIHTMNALRENSDLLLSTMDVFIKEPLMEWMVSHIDLLFVNIKRKKRM
jgi:phosphatidylinositol kinase/protein kinase (PI-3  family)